MREPYTPMTESIFSQLHIQSDGEDLIVEVLATPGSSKPGIRGLHGHALKIAVAAPPEKGKANKELERMLAQALGVPKSAVSVSAGMSNRNKKVRIRGLSRDRFEAGLAARINDL